MTKINLKEDIWIEGFNNAMSFYLALIELQSRPLYVGETSEISEDLASECVIKGDGLIVCGNYYKDYYHHSDWKHTAKESIQSACPYKYCIIKRLMSDGENE